jgi:Protein of unknown function (DUF998)
MKTAIQNTIKKEFTRNKTSRQPLQRIILLIVLGYEAAGCLLGGSLLLAAPDGRFMGMPVNMMHAVFHDFFFPGLILFSLGILNAAAFFFVLRRAASDWFMAGIALGGLFIWFVIEIIVLQELHWLHLMWGLPVLLGWVVVIPLIYSRHHTMAVRNNLLIFGILSSFWYVAINIIVPMHYTGYSVITQTVSELSAINAPTRILWVLLVIIYPILYASLGWGVLASAGRSPALHMTGSLMIVYAVLNLYWPPMHQRALIAADGATLTDFLHITWVMMTLLFMTLIMGFGAAALGKKFRLFTAATFLVFVVFGMLIGTEAPDLQTNLPTPYIGIWERINIATFMIWVVVFTIALLRKKNSSA